MAGELHTPAAAAGILKVRESWLKTKASARLIHLGVSVRAVAYWRERPDTVPRAAICTEGF
ncbi:MAG TPA: hypothetical protein VFQ44_27195 [Streptosporangiaceae bacterium]|nr:hypothetical protein [Streptosporangiaceae bacterium]